jgi:hypothetical protein
MLSTKRLLYSYANSRCNELDQSSSRLPIHRSQTSRTNRLFEERQSMPAKKSLRCAGTQKGPTKVGTTAISPPSSFLWLSGVCSDYRRDLGPRGRGLAHARNRPGAERCRTATEEIAAIADSRWVDRMMTALHIAGVDAARSSHFAVDTHPARPPRCTPREIRRTLLRLDGTTRIVSSCRRRQLATLPPMASCSSETKCSGCAGFLMKC